MLLRSQRNFEGPRHFGLIWPKLTAESYLKTPLGYKKKDPFRIKRQVPLPQAFRSSNSSTSTNYNYPILFMYMSTPVALKICKLLKDFEDFRCSDRHPGTGTPAPLIKICKSYTAELTDTPAPLLQRTKWRRWDAKGERT